LRPSQDFDPHDLRCMEADELVALTVLRASVAMKLSTIGLDL
jgi:hypothetical protein